MPLQEACSDRPRCSIVFFGSPLIDVTTRVSREFLEKYKLEPDNAYAIDESNRMIFDEIRTSSSVQMGGSVTNTVRAFVKLRPYPDLVTYFGTIGNDDFGNFFSSELGKNLSRVEEKTGKVAVLLNDRARTLVTDLGASKIFSLDSTKWVKIQAASFVYFSGFFIGVSYPTISTIIEKAGKTIIFNLAAPFLCKKYPLEMVHIYKSSFVIFGNESEHRAFAEINNITSKNLKQVVLETANRLLSNKSRVVVVTRGGGSILVLVDSDWLEFEVSPLDEDKIVDTSGAGDAFVGGFLARYVDGGSIATCVQSGIEIAKMVIQNVGFNIH